MRIGEFIRLNKTEMCGYLCSRFASPDHMWAMASQGIDPISMLNVHIPKVSPNRKLYKKFEREACGLCEIQIGRKFDMYFVNSSGMIVGCFWYYGGLQGTFMVVVDKEGKKEEVQNIFQMLNVYHDRFA